MIYHTIWVSIYSLKCFKTVWNGLFTSTHCSRLVAIAWIRMEGCSNFYRILITVVYFKDRNWISKTVNYISCSLVCKISLLLRIFRYSGQHLKSHEKEKKNTGNCKTWWVSRKRKKKNTGICSPLCVSRKRTKNAFPTTKVSL